MGQPGIASPLPKYKPARGVHAENLVGVETAELADGAREARDGHRLASAGLPLVPAWKNRLKSEARPRLGHRAYQTGHLPSANRRRDAVFADDGLHPARMRVPRRFAAPSRSPAHDEALSRHVGIGVDLADVRMLLINELSSPLPAPPHLVHRVTLQILGSPEQHQFVVAYIEFVASPEGFRLHALLVMQEFV